jgi:hypothetical protein
MVVIQAEMNCRKPSLAMEADLSRVRPVRDEAMLFSRLAHLPQCQMLADLGRSAQHIMLSK